MNNEEYKQTYFQGQGFTKSGLPLYSNHITGELYSCRDHRHKVKELGFSSLREYLLTKIDEETNCPYCGELKAEEAKPSGGLRWTCGSQDCKVKCRQESAGTVFKNMHAEIASDPVKFAEFSKRSSETAVRTWKEIKSDPERFKALSKLQSKISSNLHKVKGPSMRAGWTANRLKQISPTAVLYLVKLNSDYIKIGVTSNSVQNRFGGIPPENILFELKLDVDSAVSHEAVILESFPEVSDFNLIKGLIKNGASEIRNIIHLSNILEKLNELTTH